MATFLSVNDIETKAKTILSDVKWRYVQGGNERRITSNENSESFKRMRLRPRVGRDVRNLTTTTTLLGELVNSPIGVAPTAAHKLAWHDGEISTGKAAERKNICYTLSAHATTSMKDVAISSSGLKWMQTHIFEDRQATKYIVETAEGLGFKAIVLTMERISLPHGNRAKLMAPLLPDLDTPETQYDKNYVGRGVLGQSVTWRDFDWLRTVTQLPIIAKGIMTSEDAVLAVQHGASAVWVSNHGGRMLDTVCPTIEVLEEIVRAVGDQVEVYIDGGVRYGTDVFKALAIGARAVFVGRPILWGLAVGGADGVETVIDILNEELVSAMALTGCRTLGDINDKLVITGKDQKCRFCSENV